jgi:hypothetical protein
VIVDDDEDYDHDDDELYIIILFFFNHPSAYFEAVFPIKNSASCTSKRYSLD